MTPRDIGAIMQIVLGGGAGTDECSSWGDQKAERIPESAQAGEHRLEGVSHLLF